jgi:tetratricopeptide (TPR) repeat protein
MKIFLSAVSTEFKACRNALASDLRAVGAEVRVQEDFTQQPGTLLEKLERYINECDRVICLVGDAFGWEPQADEAPPGSEPRSYTQWEYYLSQGERLNGSRAASLSTYLYFASAAFLKENPAEQVHEAAARQRRFVDAILATGRDRQEFGSLHELRALVLRDGFRLRGEPVIQNLPYPSLGSLFKGREDFTARLREQLDRGSTPGGAAVAIQAIHGLGGVGKSRLAVEYALRREGEYRALLFVSAETPESLQAGLGALCGAGVLNLPEREATEQEVQILAALGWLRVHPGWLLILDAADTPAASEAVEALLPRLRGGHVLITTRVSDWSGAVKALELDVLELDAAGAFLLERTGGRRWEAGSDAADGAALAKELGGLALALEQAGAYISKLRISFAEYLRRWRVNESRVREWRDERLMQYPQSVATTWLTTMERLSAPALALLRILCWFAPEPVPRGVFESERRSRGLTAGLETLRATGELPGAEAAAANAEEALAELAAFSFIRWETGNEAFRIHRLVQEVTRGGLPKEERRFWLSGALALIDGYLSGHPTPDDVRSWPRWEPLRPHASGIVQRADAAGITEPTGRLMNELSLFLKARGAWAEAEPLMRRALDIDERSYGPDHPEVARDLNNLAALLKATNRLAEAEPLMRRALDIDERSYGPDHPNVAIRLNNLAQLLKATNRLAEAEPLMRGVVEILLRFTEATGHEHPHLRLASESYAGQLEEMGMPPEEVLATLNEVGEPFGVQFGSR